MSGLLTLKRLQVWSLQIAAFIALILILKALSATSALIPSPSALGRALIDLLSRGDIATHLGVTLYEAFSGLLLATLCGATFGIVVGASRTATEFINPVVLALYSVPKIIFLPILLIAFGPGSSAKIANATIHAVFPILLSAMIGMRQIPAIQLSVAESMLATRVQTVRHVYLPNMYLPLLTGIRLGTGLAFMGALLAELFESKAGVGYLINQLYSKGEIGEMLGLIFVMFLIILGLNALMKRLEGKLVRRKA